MQIQLTEGQAAELRRRAHARQVSIASLVRAAIERELSGDDGRAATWARALAVVGRFHGDAADASVEHDRYLDNAYLPPR
jgi:hypothetical protein